MFELKNVTRTAETELGYQNEAGRLLEKYAEETGKDWDLHPGVLVAWLEAKRVECSPAYWRRLRACVSWYVARIGYEGLADSIRAISTDKCAPPRERTSTKKKKSISDSELEGFAQELGHPLASQASREAYNFLVSGVLTGMRPVEWSQCEAFRERTPTEESPLGVIVIRVQNAKSTNGRSHGEYRTLRLTGLGESEMSVLLKHLDTVKRVLEHEDFSVFQARCRHKIYSTGKKLWPTKRKLPSLYSARHQASANLKADDSKSKRESGALMGHLTDRTATEHYGRKQFGKSGRNRLQADPEEVGRVKEVAKDWTPPDRSHGKGPVKS